ncbi:MAG: GNAT family N-acetyltransferase [Paludibacteraceae bacterium]|nr:GNAT family N-acetyltransferase [Paludibacteraceae bacterium]
MKPIIAPVDRSLLKSELTDERFVRPSNKAGNKIYDITAANAPNVMREIGRLRELSFRTGGGGTGEEIDIDRFDTDEPYHQLIVWDPDNEQIIGGYRYIFGNEAHLLDNGQPDIVSTHMFDFTPAYMADYMPYTIELGRAFVQPIYQTIQMGLKSLFSLDNIWDGIGALMVNNPDMRYMMGKVTIYPQYNALARDLVYAYLYRFFPDPDRIILPRNPLNISREAEQAADELFDMQADKKANYKLLQKRVRSLGETVPALFNAYIGLTDTMRTFGTGINDEFGDIYDTGIMITINDLFEEKRNRYILPYVDYLRILIETRRQSRNRGRRAALKDYRSKKRGSSSKKSTTDRQ